MPDNPNAASSDPNTRRIIAHGLRNPFRFTFRPGTNDLYLGDVGWNTWEEINRLPSPAAPVENFGWPCYEGDGRQTALRQPQPEPLRDPLRGRDRRRHAAALHLQPRGEGRRRRAARSAASSISGIDFYDGGTFPSQYNGALFFADYSRNCIWVMYPDANGIPNPATREPFINDAAGPVDLQVGPGRRPLLRRPQRRHDPSASMRSRATTRPPPARRATPTSGAAPLTVKFDGTASSDPDGDALTYAWDLDGDGAYDDSTASQPSLHLHDERRPYTVRLRVTDPGGLSATDSLTITAGTPPTADDRHPDRGHHLEGRRRDRVLGLRDERAAAARCRPPRSPGSSSCTTARRSCPTSCHEHTAPDLHRGVGRASPHRTTTTPPTSS